MNSCVLLFPPEVAGADCGDRLLLNSQVSVGLLSGADEERLGEAADGGLRDTGVIFGPLVRRGVPGISDIFRRTNFADNILTRAILVVSNPAILQKLVADSGLVTPKP